MSASRKTLFEYVVVLHSSEGDADVVVGPDVIPAYTVEAVKVAATRAIPADAAADPDLLEILVRPFAR